MSVITQRLTGSLGIMRIVDYTDSPNDKTVEVYLWLRDRPDTTIRRLIVPWSFSKDGVRSNIQSAVYSADSFHPPPLMKLATIYVADVHTFTFHIEDTGDPIFGGPIDLTITLAAQAPWTISVKVGDVYKKAIPYVNVAGEWKQAIPYVAYNGNWRPVT